MTHLLVLDPMPTADLIRQTDNSSANAWLAEVGIRLISLGLLLIVSLTI